ncbi:MAG: hypothetical protein BGO77_03580 [Caedibacter sp. 37-49]|nr:MAG: hypothetical protein BGO77_03580 [Caedibacter sp. 37-49]
MTKSSCKDYTGFYIGGHFGYGSGKSEWTGKDCGCYTPVQYKRDIGTRGALGGLHIGYGKEFTPKISRGNVSKHKVAFVPGLGVSMMLAKNIIVDVEATHSIYKKQSNAVKFANCEVVERGRIKSHVTDLTLRASYKF